VRVVVENSEAEVARRRAADEIIWPLEQLAANLIRTVRGAGTPGRLASQMVAVLTKFERYRDAVGSYPSGGEISEALSIRYRHHEGGTDYDEFEYAEADVVQGALQIAASELLGQSAQKSAGQTELLAGVRRLEAYWEAERKRSFDPRSSRPRRRT
jgi:hypothetical protein